MPNPLYLPAQALLASLFYGAIKPWQELNALLVPFEYSFKNIVAVAANPVTKSRLSRPQTSFFLSWSARFFSTRIYDSTHRHTQTRLIKRELQRSFEMKR